jgi:hypothetical protein
MQAGPDCGSQPSVHGRVVTGYGPEPARVTAKESPCARVVKSSSKDKARHLLKLREGTVARRERVVVDSLPFDDAVKLILTDFDVNEKNSLTDMLGRIKHLTAHFGGVKLSQITTGAIEAYIKHRRAEERIVSRERTTVTDDTTVVTVPEVRRKPSNAQINRETQVLGRMFTLAKQDERIIHIPHIPKTEGTQAAEERLLRIFGLRQRSGSA